MNDFNNDVKVITPCNILKSHIYGEFLYAWHLKLSRWFSLHWNMPFKAIHVTYQNITIVAFSGFDKLKWQCQGHFNQRPGTIIMFIFTWISHTLKTKLWCHNKSSKWVVLNAFRRSTPLSQGLSVPYLHPYWKNDWTSVYTHIWKLALYFLFDRAFFCIISVSDFYYM